MPEVKRYWVHWNDQLYVADKNGDLVMSDDFDRVTAERDGLQISLNTADQSIDDLNAAISRRTHRVRELEGLLRLARQFVTNGVELGYITMPDPETPDAAHDLVPMIDAALKP